MTVYTIDFEFNVEKGWVTISNYTGSARMIEIADNTFDGGSKVVVEYDGKEYKYGQLKSLYIKINCQ